jgi:hypothetical protein
MLLLVTKLNLYSLLRLPVGIGRKWLKVDPWLGHTPGARKGKNQKGIGGGERWN